MRKMLTTVSCVLLVACAGLVSFGQVKVVDPASASARNLASPMKLEVPLDSLWSAAGAQPWSTVEVGAYSCEGVRLEQVSLETVDRGSEKPPRTRAVVRMVNKSKEDVDINVQLEVISDEKVLAASEPIETSIEEDDSNTEKAWFPVHLRGIKPGASPRLRVTVVVKED